MDVNSHVSPLIFPQAFLHDFEGGSSTDAQKIIQARQKSVSTTMKYAGFIVRSRAPNRLTMLSELVDLDAVETFPYS